MYPKPKTQKTQKHNKNFSINFSHTKHMKKLI